MQYSSFFFKKVPKTHCTQRAQHQTAETQSWQLASYILDYIIYILFPQELVETKIELKGEWKAYRVAGFPQ